MIFTKLKRSLKDSIQNATARNSSEILCSNILLPLFYGRPYLPITNWAPSFKTLSHLLNEIIINKRTAFIEFGSGVSTILVARLFAQNKIESHFFSVDDNADWIEIQRNSLQKEGLERFVSFIHAPLESVTFSNINAVCWYDSKKIQESIGTTQFDLMFVDGPKGDTPFARYGAIPFLTNNISKNYCVLLDDTTRKDEQHILRMWKDELQADTINFYGTHGSLYCGDHFESEATDSKTKKILNNPI